MNLPLSIPALMLLVSTAVGAADFSKVIELRRSGDYPQAAGLLKNYSSPARYESLPASERMEFLQGVLELAHVKALQNDVPGALALLNWAENLSEPYPRAYSCVKYAEILLDIGEPERARGYLKSFDEVKVTNAKSDERGKAIGQGGRNADLGAAWRELAERAELLKAQAEFVELKEKFGATYANYVKLRRLQKQASKSKPDYESAMALADEIIKSAPDSQFAGAAGYLKGELMTARLTEDSPKREIEAVKKYLSGYIKKDTLYKGEALMLLGKISLEIEWDAKDAEKHYTAALAHFRSEREKSDAINLYAPLSNDLRQQVTPTQRPLSFNEWYRTVHHSEDPLKLYNTATAPPWYVEDREKNCMVLCGFLAWMKGDYMDAQEKYLVARSLVPEFKNLADRGIHSDFSRLLASCREKQMMLNPEETAMLKGRELLKIKFGEFHTVTSRFEDAQRIFFTVLQDKSASLDARACAIFCIAEAYELNNKMELKKAREYWLMLTSEEKYGKAVIFARAISRLGMNYDSTAEFPEAIAAFEECIKKRPDSEAAEDSLYKLVYLSYFLKSKKDGDEMYKRYTKRYPNGFHHQNVALYIKAMQKLRGETW